MTVEPAVSQRCYDIHGVGVAVGADEPAVLEAIDMRLRDFRSETSPPRPDVRLEYVSGGSSTAPGGAMSRPVYDTRYGSLHYFPESDALFGSLAGVSLLCAPGRGTALVRSAAFTGQALYLATHPLATIALMELLERRALYSLHAACLATGGGRGVLIAGPSGAGKSTLALALARSGLAFLSDDVVFLSQLSAGTVGALGFADAIGVTEGTAERFGELRDVLDEAPAPGFPKRLRRIDELFAVPVCAACVPATLVLSEVRADEPSRIALLDPGEAMLRLVPDVLLTEPAATQAHLGAIATLVGQVRCYDLASGTDLERAAELVRDLV